MAAIPKTTSRHPITTIFTLSFYVSSLYMTIAMAELEPLLLSDKNAKLVYCNKIYKDALKC